MGAPRREGPENRHQRRPSGRHALERRRQIDTVQLRRTATGEWLIDKLGGLGAVGSDAAAQRRERGVLNQRLGTQREQRRSRAQSAQFRRVGSPGALQPPAPSDPGVTVSRHRALLIGPKTCGPRASVRRGLAVGRTARPATGCSACWFAAAWISARSHEVDHRHLELRNDYRASAGAVPPALVRRCSELHRSASATRTRAGLCTDPSGAL